VCADALASATRGIHAIAGRLVAYSASIVWLCLPALWNGFPLMFDDVGGYLERWPTHSLGLGRSATYGVLLWITRDASFVPVILLQALVTTFVIDRALKIFRPGWPAWSLPGVVALLSLTTGLAMFASKALPDAWAGPAVLALHLLAWHSERLTLGERVAMIAIIVFAGAAHMAIFGLLAAVSALYGLLFLCRRPLRMAPAGVAILAPWLGFALLLATDAIVAGRPAPTPGGEAFLLGRLIEDGGAKITLDEECPRQDWQLCQFKDALPDYAEAFIFYADSPLQKIGGVDDPRAQQEMRSIIVRAIIDHPLAQLNQAIVLTTEQFVDIGTSGVMEPLMAAHARWTIQRFTPWLLPGFDQARQQTQQIDLSLWSDWIVIPFGVAASLALPLLAAVLWRRGFRREAMLPALLFVTLMINAAICGVISSPNDRYQARLVWLAPLVIGLALPPLQLRLGRKSAGSAVTNTSPGP
jgi:hypothetical protein